MHEKKLEIRNFKVVSILTLHWDNLKIRKYI